MVVVKRERRVNLGQGEMRVLFVNGVGAPAIRQMVKNNLDHLDILVANPCDTPFILKNVCDAFHCCYVSNLSLPALPRKPNSQVLCAVPPGL